MRISGLFTALLFTAGLTQASMDEDMSIGTYADNLDEGNDYMLSCTELGVAANLTGDELDAYVRDCMEELNSAGDSSQGEES